jgi:hypothetical protein
MLGHHLAGMKGLISGRTEEEFENSLLEAMAEPLFSLLESSWTVRLARSDGQNHRDH